MNTQFLEIPLDQIQDEHNSKYLIILHELFLSRKKRRYKRKLIETLATFFSNSAKILVVTTRLPTTTNTRPLRIPILRILLGIAENEHARYFATFCITSGTYTTIGLVIAWCEY